MRATIVVCYDSRGEISVGAVRSGADNAEDRIRLARRYAETAGQSDGEEGISFRQVEIVGDAENLGPLCMTEYPELPGTGVEEEKGRDSETSKEQGGGFIDVLAAEERKETDGILAAWGAMDSAAKACGAARDACHNAAAAIRMAKSKAAPGLAAVWDRRAGTILDIILGIAGR